LDEDSIIALHGWKKKMASLIQFHIVAVGVDGKEKWHLDSHEGWCNMSGNWLESAQVIVNS
jgi:hypothetical protein